MSIDPKLVLPTKYVHRTNVFVPRLPHSVPKVFKEQRFGESLRALLFAGATKRETVYDSSTSAAHPHVTLHSNVRNSHAAPTIETHHVGVADFKVQIAAGSDGKICDSEPHCPKKKNPNKQAASGGRFVLGLARPGPNQPMASEETSPQVKVLFSQHALKFDYAHFDNVVGEACI